VNFLKREREREREQGAECRVQSKIDTRNSYGEKKGKGKKLEFEKGVLLETLQHLENFKVMNP
jgi:hypothetical protein